MIKNYLNRERLEKIKSWRETYGAGSNVMLPAEEAEELARIALAAMDSEPHTDDELSNLLWYSQEATCHSDPNYYCEFQRLATPGLIAGIIRELHERRKADSEPVADVVAWSHPNEERKCDIRWRRHDVEPGPLYHHAQPAPVVLKISDEMTPEQAYEIGDYHGDPVEVFVRGANWMRQHIIDSTLSAAPQEFKP